MFTDVDIHFHETLLAFCVHFSKTYVLDNFFRERHVKQAFVFQI